MERIEKLTEIYHEHMEIINGEKIEKKQLKNSLIDILDSAAHGSRSTSTSALGFSPVKGSQTNNGSMSGFASFQPADITTNQNGIRGKTHNLSEINYFNYRNFAIFITSFPTSKVIQT